MRLVPLRLMTVAILAAAAALACAGCASSKVLVSSDPVRWSGLGLKVTLPPGIWHVERLKEGVFFREKQGTHIAILRIPARENESDIVALHRLFVHFREKTPVRTWTADMHDGRCAACMEYDVRDSGRLVRLRAAIVRRGSWKYALAQWGNAPETLEYTLGKLEFSDPPL